MSTPTCSRPVAPLRILFVESHKDTLDVLGTIMQRQGYSVHRVTNCATALLLAGRELLFDLLLCEINLVDGDGCQLLATLRKIPPLRDIKAIALTGLGMPDDITRTQAAGFDAHVLKPVDLDELVGVIERVRHSHGRQFIVPGYSFRLRFFHPESYEPLPAAS